MKGVYFIANDNCLDLAISFLNSFRVVEPNLSLCLIPFNDECDEIRSLAKEYGFTIWADETALQRCDAISNRFHPVTVGQYRKLCMWDGPFDRFIYIDIDTVILSPLDKPFIMLESYDIITAISDLPHLRAFVWRDGVESISPTLDLAYSANTGFIGSRRGTLSWANIESDLEVALALKPYMALECTEQPLLNYLIVTSGFRYSSLSKIRRDENRPDMPRAIWSGRLRKIDSLPASTLLVHWAGEWQRGEHHKSTLWKYFRHLRDGH